MPAFRVVEAFGNVGLPRHEDAAPPVRADREGPVAVVFRAAVAVAPQLLSVRREFYGENIHVLFLRLDQAGDEEVSLLIRDDGAGFGVGLLAGAGFVEIGPGLAAINEGRS